MARIIKRVKKTYYRTLGYYPTSINGLKFKCDVDHMSFWKKVSKGRWEPHTYEILSRFLNPDAVYYDIGSWIGTTVIYAARRCGQVVCFEPDPVAYRYLLWNIELNGLKNVMPLCIALADGDGIMKMASFGGSCGDSTMSLLKSNQEKGVSYAMTLKWETWAGMSKVGKIDLLKIDIEGGEFMLLPSMRDYLALHKPTVYLSTHSPFVETGQRRENMQRIVEIMGIYDKCYNERMEPISIAELITEESLAQFKSYVFTD